ncbi:MAG: NAD-dependent epimerase/dehydratase [Actinomycetia bacterium]|jgi:nucleoside-diphosphate-sugar epimerase|nr:NAD-dependent epimerase/dehydratase [Actinomycetes bacterium]MDQ1653554.1 uronate dehydrogenase [Cryptosporangiaceae bacterium]
MTERVLITGAAGRIGTMLRPRLAREGRTLRLLDREPIGAPSAAEETVLGDVTDLPALIAAADGCDAIVHLGGIAGEDTWDAISAINIQGTYSVFEAARAAGVPRVIFASSNHAVGFVPRTSAPVSPTEFFAPDTYYGVSKVAGEALASLYADRYGIDALCLRIGSCFDEPSNTRMLSTWLSPDDCGRLVEAALTTPDPGFAVVWGISANTRAWFDLGPGRALGFDPQDDAEKYAPDLIARDGDPDLTVLPHSHVGGDFCSPALDAPLPT